MGTKWEVAPSDFDPAGAMHPAFPERGPLRFIALPRVAAALEALGKSKADFVEAFGRNKAEGEPRAWYWTPLYVGGNRRWLPREAINHLDEIADRG